MKKARHLALFVAVVVAAASPYLQSLESWSELKTPQAIGVLAAMVAGKVVAFLMRRPADVDDDDVLRRR